jgi:alpha-glucoside transport system permease protein
MAVAEAGVRIAPPAVEEGVARKIARTLGKAPVHIALVFIGVLWLVPTVGLFLTSLMSPADISAGGWWQIFTKPSIATLESYRQLWNKPRAAHGAADDARNRDRRDGPSRSWWLRSPPTPSPGWSSPAGTGSS